MNTSIDRQDPLPSSAPAPRSFLLLVVALTALVFAVDQGTKFLVLWYLPPGGIQIIPGLFDIILAYNKGAAFGILADYPDGIRQLALAFTTIFALCAVFYMINRYYRESTWGMAALGLILGGACGNILDRMRLGMVVDFIDWYVGSYHWPAFNIADSAICVGVAILIFLKPITHPPDPVR